MFYFFIFKLTYGGIHKADGPFMHVSAEQTGEEKL